MIMAGRLIGQENNPRVQPVGVGETLRRIMAKYVLKVVGKEAEEDCWTEQLFWGMAVGI